MKKLHIKNMEVGKEYILLHNTKARTHRPIKVKFLGVNMGVNSIYDEGASSFEDSNGKTYNSKDFFYDYKYDFYKIANDLVLWVMDSMSEITFFEGC